MWQEMTMVREFHRKHKFSEKRPLADDHSALDGADRRCLDDAAEDLGQAAKQMLQLAVDPRNSAEKVLMMRMHLIAEECAETLQAALTGNEELLLDALADLTYVVVGTAVSYDLPLPAAFDEVHRSNMTKEKQSDDPHAARIRSKGPNYVPPDLAKILKQWRDGTGTSGKAVTLDGAD